MSLTRGPPGFRTGLGLQKRVPISCFDRHIRRPSISTVPGTLKGPGGLALCA